MGRKLFYGLVPCGVVKAPKSMRHQDGWLKGGRKHFIIVSTRVELENLNWRAVISAVACYLPHIFLQDESLYHHRLCKGIFAPTGLAEDDIEKPSWYHTGD
jgi:hypothetical protein